MGLPSPFRLLRLDSQGHTCLAVSTLTCFCVVLLFFLLKGPQPLRGQR